MVYSEYTVKQDTKTFYSSLIHAISLPHPCLSLWYPTRFITLLSSSRLTFFTYLFPFSVLYFISYFCHKYVIIIIASLFMGLSVLSYLIVFQIGTSVLTYIQLHWFFLTGSSLLLRLFICVMACLGASFSTSFLIVTSVHIFSLVLHFMNLFTSFIDVLLCIILKFLPNNSHNFWSKKKVLINCFLSLCVFWCWSCLLKGFSVLLLLKVENEGLCSGKLCVRSLGWTPTVKSKHQAIFAIICNCRCQALQLLRPMLL